MSQGLVISPAAYLSALRTLSLPEGHVLTLAEYSEAVRIEGEVLRS